MIDMVGIFNIITIIITITIANGETQHENRKRCH